jgi:hypothetical protein
MQFGDRTQWLTEVHHTTSHLVSKSDKLGLRAMCECWPVLA